MNIQGTNLAKLLNNQMKRSQSNIGKAMEKLSTGQRIRSAANDASGLAISQKMSALVRGSHQAIRNVQDASSLVEVADGAMQEMTDILQRIRELTIQAMNGTNTEVKPSSLTTADTTMIQSEVDELKKELNKIVHNTEFNQKKILSNTEQGEFIYEDRSVSKIIKLSELPKSPVVDISNNLVWENSIPQTSYSPPINYSTSRSVSSTASSPESYIGTTVMDHLPKWSADGTSIVFTSSRDNDQYMIPADGNVDPVLDGSISLAAQRKISSNSLMQLTHTESTLTVQKRSSIHSGWTDVRTFTYNGINDGSAGYSFSPKTDASGNTSFVYADNMGNIQRVDVNINTQTVGNSVPLISTSDTVNFPPIDNTVTLPSAPNLYNMNSKDASLKIEKYNDDGGRELIYWDGIGAEPSTGYYTVTGNKVTFYNEAAIGVETIDDAQDYYRFSYTPDGTGDNLYTESIPAFAEIYNMHGEEGPRSLNIFVGGQRVERTDLLSSQPSDPENTHGVFVNEATGKVEFYGDFRPAFNESVRMEYMSDADGRNETYSLAFTTAVDTYNLESNTGNRSLRVTIDGSEIPYDTTKTNGYYFDKSTGRLSFYGSYRPDVPSNPAISVEYVYDRSTSSTSSEVYGIPLNSDSPEVYNLGDSTAPNSIRVFRNGTEIDYDAEQGFQYDASANMIELHGTSRPNVGDNFTIKFIESAYSTNRLDDKVEVRLTNTPETYGLSDSSIPSTFKVIVDGSEIPYDATKTNGYIYNSSTGRIEIYGDSRPDASHTSDPDVKVSFVYESPAVTGNETYDFRLSSNTMDYGLGSNTEPNAIRVYYKGTEVPLDAENGYSFNSDTNQLSLHGSYRPDKGDSPGDYKIYSITNDDIQAVVPENSYIYKVDFNGQEIQKVQDASGTGYTYDGRTIELVGNARPNITNTTYQFDLTVQYFDSLEVELNDSMPGEFFHQYCNHEVSEELLESEIDPTALDVTLSGITLNADQYSLIDNKIVLNQERITLSAGDHELRVGYRARQGIGYEPNKFVFHTGANSGQSLKVDISSFDNLLRDTNVICVRNYEDAEKGLEVIDNAINFVLNELGNVGAVENRLDHIARNLSVMEENTMASMSRIQDTDMAKQIMNLTKEQILSQAQQAIGAQIKQSQLQVIKLLQ